jgi:hypothetical protein
VSRESPETTFTLGGQPHTHSTLRTPISKPMFYAPSHALYQTPLDDNAYTGAFFRAGVLLRSTHAFLFKNNKKT